MTYCIMSDCYIVNAVNAMVSPRYRTAASALQREPRRSPAVTTRSSGHPLLPCAARGHWFDHRHRRLPSGPAGRLGLWAKNVYNTNRKGNVLFNNTLHTFYLRLYGIRHMVKETCCYHIGYSF